MLLRLQTVSNKGDLVEPCIKWALIYIFSCLLHQEKKEPHILRWKYPTLTTDMFNPNIFVTSTSLAHTVSMFIIFSTLLLQGFYHESLAKSEVNTIFFLQPQM